MKSLIDKTEKNNNLISKLIEKEEKNRLNQKGELSDMGFENLKITRPIKAIQESQHLGTITLKTSKTNLSSQKIYEAYKQRQHIEQFFKTYDNHLGFNKSYMSSDYSLEGWLFLNHITSTIGFRIINQIANAKQTKNISLKDLIEKLKKIKTSKINDQFYINKIRKKDKVIFKKLGIDNFLIPKN